ncbi:chaperonin 10-like protein [Aspergillus californicus]
MPENTAAWILEAKADLQILSSPYTAPADDEIVIQNHAIAIQPFDANVRGNAYIPVPYPFILGNGTAGIVEEVGSGITRFKKGDRVVSDTPTYQLKEAKYGAWQKYVVTKDATTARIPDGTTFEDAAAIPFALLTAVSALSLKLGMARAGEGAGAAPGIKGKALIWGASGSVGGYAVQYASSAGYEVIATASPRKFEYVRELGATQVIDYKDSLAVSKLRDVGPYDFIMCASGDAPGANAISQILQPTGGKFASTRPKSDAMDLASNVELVYDVYSMTTQKPENEEFSRWYYGYLSTALAGGVTPTPLEKRGGGLARIQEACEDVLGGKSAKKLVLNPQE